MRLAVEATNLAPCFVAFAPRCRKGSFSPCDTTWNIVNASVNKPIKHLSQESKCPILGFVFGFLRYLRKHGKSPYHVIDIIKAMNMNKALKD
ncbi:hypothetical protein QYF36_005803 [Acer negundo]|nr:hypothetical protein QYF36_005803 [Acer negundo]